MPETVLVALVAAGSAIGGRAIDRAFDAWAARKAGLGPLRETLVATLEATVSAQHARIGGLEADLAAERQRSDALEARLATVETLLDACLRRRRPRSGPQHLNSHSPS